MDDVSAPDETPPEASRKTTRSSREGIGLGRSKVTECLTQSTKKSREEARSYLPIYEEYADQRPKTRGDCVGGSRPCPWVSCKHNNYLDVRATGATAGKSVIYNFPDTLPEDVLPERSCALDIADQGGATLEDVAKLTNLTRERIRQVQAKALKRAEHFMEKHGLIDEDQYRGEPIVGHATSESSLLRRKKDDVVEESEETQDDSLADGDAISFMSDSPRAEFLVTTRVWRIYLRTSNEQASGTSTIFPRIEKEVPPRVDISLPVPVARRHNGGMATKKKAKDTKPKRSLGDLNENETKVLNAYTQLRESLGTVPNNLRISKLTKLTKLSSTVGNIRKALVKASLAVPSPRGKTKAPSKDDKWAMETPKQTAARDAKSKRRKSLPTEPHKVVEHQQLPDDVTQSAAEVLSLPRGPLADAANAIRNQLIINEDQRAKLTAALKALGDLA